MSDSVIGQGEDAEQLGCEATARSRIRRRAGLIAHASRSEASHLLYRPEVPIRHFDHVHGGVDRLSAIPSPAVASANASTNHRGVFMRRQYSQMYADAGAPAM
jgi:hypothetical protein